MNKADLLAESQSHLAYNATNINIPKDNKLNIYMGIGFWSAQNGLSLGLPVDVMQMLLSAVVLRSQIEEVNPGKPSKVVILLADSMAIREGADKDKVFELVSLYKKCLSPLLALLNMTANSEVILSSKLEEAKEYQAALQLLDQDPVMQTLKSNATHYAYIRTQTAITHYLHTHQDVGVKVGWINKASSRQLNNHSTSPIKSWDEMRFDRIYRSICQNSTLQCLYAKAGLKQHIRPGQGGRLQMQVHEGCPYTAYEEDRRYIIQTDHQLDIKKICWLKKRVAAQWKCVANVCSDLRQLKIVNDKILPVNCIQKSHDVTTVYRMLNYWSNILEPSEQPQKAKSTI
jgi:hypothetical protein